MLQNLASSLFLTERDAEFDENEPKVKGRVVTTLEKAKEVRPLVEKCITIARKSLAAGDAAEEFATDAERGTDEWRTWRDSEQWRKWADARAPAVAARRHVLRLIRDKKAVRVLFEEIAPRFADRDGGYTRIMRLATVRLGDAGTRAILEFVGKHDRVVERSEKPAFSDDEIDDEVDDEVVDTTAEDDSAAGESAEVESADDTVDKED